MMDDDNVAPTASEHSDRYRIGEWTLIRSRNLLRQRADGTEHALEPQAVELLAYLAARPGEVVALDALHGELWRGRVVTDSSIYRLVAELRRLLGDDARSPRYIETVRKRGYRLVAEVAPEAREATAPPEAREATAPPEVPEPTQPSVARSSATTSETPIRTDSSLGRSGALGGRRRPLTVVAVLVAVAVIGWFTVLRDGADPGSSARRDAGGVSSSLGTTLAVLPLEVLTPATPTWLADGLARTISDRLAAIGELTVIAYPSVREAVATDAAPAAVAARLGATRLLAGTVVADDPPEAVRISLSLLSPEDGVTRWAGTFDASLGDVLSLYERLAADVAAELDLRLAAPTRRDARDHDPEAIAAWMRGLVALDTGFQQQNLNQAIGELDIALERAPDFVPALAARAVAHTRLYGNYHDRSDGRLALARADVDAALARDPDGADARFASGYLASATGDPVRGRLQLARALERRPGDAEILVALGRTLSRLGEHEEATMHLRRAVDLDPLNARFRYELGLSQMFVGEFAAADDGFVAAISQQPDMVEPYLYRAWVQISWLGNTRGANLRLAQWRDAFGEDEMIGVMLSAGLWGLFTWTTPELDAALASWSTEESGGDPAVWHLAMAEIAFKRGDLTGAADHFERAAALRTRDVANAPDSPWLAAELAIACAGAGRETEARQAADRAVALNPVSEDEWDGSDMLWVRAMVLSMLGDHDAAIAQIEEAARYPTLTTPNALLADPHWAWLAEHPAMKKLAEADGAAWKREH